MCPENLTFRHLARWRKINGGEVLSRHFATSSPLGGGVVVAVGERKNPSGGVAALRCSVGRFGFGQVGTLPRANAHGLIDGGPGGQFLFLGHLNATGPRPRTKE